MRTNSLMALLVVCGSGHTLFAQVNVAVPAPTFDARLVVDGDPFLANAGINYGTNSLIPGPNATAVGITLMVRVTASGTNPNLGVLGSFAGNSNAFRLNTIHHNDSVSDQTSPLWTSPALAFQRGLSRFSDDGQLQQTTFGVLSTQGVNGAPRANFRALLAIQQTSNTPSQNSSVPQPSLTPYNTRTQANGHGNGWIGVPDRALGNFVSPPGSAAILSVVTQRAAVPDDGSGTNPFTNYATNDQDPLTPGAQSPWYGLYHFVFVPRTGVDQLRSVTVQWSGLTLSYTGDAFLQGGNWVPVAQRVTDPSGAFTVEINPISVTFTVPTPSALGLLSLGALISTRRRR